MRKSRVFTHFSDSDQKDLTISFLFQFFVCFNSRAVTYLSLIDKQKKLYRFLPLFLQRSVSGDSRFRGNDKMKRAFSSQTGITSACRIFLCFFLIFTFPPVPAESRRSDEITVALGPAVGVAIGCAGLALTAVTTVCSKIDKRQNEERDQQIIEGIDANKEGIDANKEGIDANKAMNMEILEKLRRQEEREEERQRERERERERRRERQKMERASSLMNGWHQSILSPSTVVEIPRRPKENFGSYYQVWSGEEDISNYRLGFSVVPEQLDFCDDPEKDNSSKSHMERLSCGSMESWETIGSFSLCVHEGDTVLFDYGGEVSFLRGWEDSIWESFDFQSFPRKYGADSKYFSCYKERYPTYRVSLIIEEPIKGMWPAKDADQFSFRGEKPDRNHLKHLIQQTLQETSDGLIARLLKPDYTLSSLEGLKEWELKNDRDFIQNLIIEAMAYRDGDDSELNHFALVKRDDFSVEEKSKAREFVSKGLPEEWEIIGVHSYLVRLRIEEMRPFIDQKDEKDGEAVGRSDYRLDVFLKRKFEEIPGSVWKD